MEQETNWYCEDAQENDERIAKLEAEIMEGKALLKGLGQPFEEDFLFY